MLSTHPTIEFTERLWTWGVNLWLFRKDSYGPKPHLVGLYHLVCLVGDLAYFPNGKSTMTGESNKWRFFFGNPESANPSMWYCNQMLHIMYWSVYHILICIDHIHDIHISIANIDICNDITLKSIPYINYMIVNPQTLKYVLNTLIIYMLFFNIKTSIENTDIKLGDIYI